MPPLGLAKGWHKFFKGGNAPPRGAVKYPVLPCNAISEVRPPLSNSSSEAGALPLEVRIENDRTENFLSQNFLIVFWKPLFSTFHVTLSL